MFAALCLVSGAPMAIQARRARRNQGRSLGLSGWISFELGVKKLSSAAEITSGDPSASAAPSAKPSAPKMGGKPAAGSAKPAASGAPAAAPSGAPAAAGSAKPAASGAPAAAAPSAKPAAAAPSAKPAAAAPSAKPAAAPAKK
jgi:hypothetical protein